MIFPRGVRQLPKVLLFFNFFAENCMKMKEFGPRGGARAPGASAPPLIRQWIRIRFQRTFSDSISVSNANTFAASRGTRHVRPLSNLFHFHAVFTKSLPDNRLASPPMGSPRFIKKRIGNKLLGERHLL